MASLAQKFVHGQEMRVQRGGTALTFDGAVIRERGVTFAVVVVRPHIVQSRSEASQAISAFRPCFPGIPVVLMAKDSRGASTYFGRPEIARFLASVPLAAILRKTYSVSA
jgi:hypothetical protein